jgi:hypothetical protein
VIEQVANVIPESFLDRVSRGKGAFAWVIESQLNAKWHQQPSQQVFLIVTSDLCSYLLAQVREAFSADVCHLFSSASALLLKLLVPFSGMFISFPI